ncbi:MAG: methyltransferase [Lachnospiraceae bacterium]|nr:methyltransferase [Lachnospiraceae bacterium]
MSDYTVELKEKTLTLHTEGDVFSPTGLDRGTAAMLSLVTFSPEDKVLDLGCGCGIVGILAASLIGADRVTLCDVSKTALACARQNAAANGVADGLSICHSDGLTAITDCDYTMILSNPPYHTDFSVAKGFIEDGWRHLAMGGRLYMVTKRKDWYKNKLISVFGGVHIEEIDGYYVFTAEKRPRKTIKKAPADSTPPKLSKKLARKQARRTREQ